MPTGPVCAPLPTVRHHTTISPPPPAFPRRVIKTGRGAASWSVLEGRNSPRPGGGCGAWRARPALPVRMRQHWCRRAPCAGPWVRLARPAFCQNSTPPTTWGLPAAPWRRRPLWRGVCRARWQHGRARSSDREGCQAGPCHYQWPAAKAAGGYRQRRARPGGPWAPAHDGRAHAAPVGRPGEPGPPGCPPTPAMPALKGEVQAASAPFGARWASGACAGWHAPCPAAGHDAVRPHCADAPTRRTRPSPPP